MFRRAAWAALLLIATNSISIAAPHKGALEKQGIEFHWSEISPKRNMRLLQYAENFSGNMVFPREYKPVLDARDYRWDQEFRSFLRIYFFNFILSYCHRYFLNEWIAWEKYAANIARSGTSFSFRYQAKLFFSWALRMWTDRIEKHVHPCVSGRGSTNILQGKSNGYRGTIDVIRQPADQFDSGKFDLWSLFRSQHLSRELVRINSRLSGGFGGGNRSLHICGLSGRTFSHRYYGVFQLPTLPSEHSQLEGGNYGQNDGKDRNDSLRSPPILRRFFFYLAAVASGFPLSIWGWMIFDKRRRLLGSCFIAAGGLLGLLGFGLLALTVFPASWGWWF